jgi:hypothetical protein
VLHEGSLKHVVLKCFLRGISIGLRRIGKS